MLQQKNIGLKGLDTFYLEGGCPKKHKDTVLIVHGWGLSSRAFSQTMLHYSKTNHVVGLDLPGFGRSQQLSNFWCYEAYASFVNQFITKVAKRPVHLVGQSMGGGISAVVSAMYPKQVKSLVMVNSAGIPMGKMPSLVKRAGELSEQMWQSGFRHENWPILHDFWTHSTSRLSFLFKSVCVPVHHDIRHHLPKVKKPVLLVWGENDYMLPVAVGEEFAKNLSSAKLIVIKDGHHEWSAVHPEKFVSLTSKFHRKHA